MHEQVPYAIVVRNADRARVGRLDRIMELRLVHRFNDVSNWEILLPMGLAQTELLQDAGSIVIHTGDESGPILFSGPVEEFEDHRNQSQPGDGTLWVRGCSDDHVIADRIAFPDPSEPVTNQSEQGHDTRTGVAETVIKAYVSANTGPDALAARRVDHLVINGDEFRGATVTGNPRMKPLMELVNELCTAGGDLGWHVFFEDGHLKFDVYEPEDKTDIAKFGWDIGNLLQYEYRRAAPKITRSIVGGGGQDISRIFREVGEPEAEELWLRRIESFRDARDTEVADVMDQRGQEELVENGAVETVRIEAVDIPNLRFGVDYKLGDKVSVVPRPGIVIEDVIREVNVTWTPGESVKATAEVGSSSVTSTPAMIKKLEELNKRVAELEAQESS